MRLSLKSVLTALILISLLSAIAAAQAGRNRQQNNPPQKKSEKVEPTPTPTPAVEQQQSAPPDDPRAVQETGGQEIDTVKVETNLVTVPVIVSDRGDKYITDMKKEEFSVYEDGVKQEISFFETVTAPFNVVLMLDTSGSTQEKLGAIQYAAIEFTKQLQKADRVKVISFDDQVRDLCDFTSDRAVLQWAIRETRPGGGTKLYDAFGLALRALGRVKGRKAIVLFTDGVDYHSDRESYDRNRRMLEEAGVIVYPIRYDTRAEVERIIRQQTQGGQVINLGTILGGGAPSTTPTTFPGGTTIPGGGGGGGGTGTGTGMPKMPGGVIISGSRRDSRDDTVTDDMIRRELDQLYMTADAYLNDLANISGGQLHRADDLINLPRVFERIASELRTQYALGYYPARQNPRDGKFHKIKVSTARQSVSVRAKPGYRAQSAGK